MITDVWTPIVELGSGEKSFPVRDFRAVIVSRSLLCLSNADRSLRILHNNLQILHTSFPFSFYHINYQAFPCPGNFFFIKSHLYRSLAKAWRGKGSSSVTAVKSKSFGNLNQRLNSGPASSHLVITYQPIIHLTMRYPRWSLTRIPWVAWFQKIKKNK